MDDWCNKGRGMCYPVWGDSAYKIFLSSYRRVAHAMDDWCNKGRGYVLSCLWDSAYKIFLSSYRRVAHAVDDWCNKGRGMCYPVCGIVHIKYSLVLIGE